MLLACVQKLSQKLTCPTVLHGLRVQGVGFRVDSTRTTWWCIGTCGAVGVVYGATTVLTPYLSNDARLAVYRVCDLYMMDPYGLVFCNLLAWQLETQMSKPQPLDP